MLEHFAQALEDAFHDLLRPSVRDSSEYNVYHLAALGVASLAGAHIWFGGRFAVSYIGDVATGRSNTGMSHTTAFAVYVLVLLLYLFSAVLFGTGRRRQGLMLLLMPVGLDIGILGMLSWAILHV